MQLPDRAPAEPAWDHQRIAAEIRRRGSSIAALARDNDIQRGTLQVIFYRRYPRGQKIVAAFIGRTLHELWPQWYDEHDKPLPLAGRVYIATRSAA